MRLNEQQRGVVREIRKSYAEKKAARRELIKRGEQRVGHRLVAS